MQSSALATPQRQRGFFILGFVLIGILLLPQTTHAVTPTAKQYRDEINRVRHTKQLAPLISSYTLNRAALRRLQDMANNHYFGHTSPAGRNFSTFIKLGPAKFNASGEVLSKKYSSADKSVQAWLASTSHAAQLQSSTYTHIGAAVGKITVKGKTLTVAVVLFGRVR